MFGNILGKKKEEENKTPDNSAMIERISKMNLTDIKTYVNNRVTDFEVSEDGLCEVVKHMNSKASNGKRFIETDAMDSKIKKAFDIICLVGKNKLVTITAVELITEFLTMYDDIIKKYDHDNKDIYEDKIKDSVNVALQTVSAMAAVNKRMKALS